MKNLPAFLILFTYSMGVILPTSLMFLSIIALWLIASNND